MHLLPQKVPGIFQILEGGADLVPAASDVGGQTLD